MTTIEIKPEIKVGLDEIMDGVSKLTTPELENFHRRVGGLLSGRKAKSLPGRERVLIAKIREEVLPAGARRQFEALREKGGHAALSVKEHREYKRLLREIEAKSLERLTCLVELSQLRGASLAETMEQLGLKAVNPYNG